MVYTIVCVNYVNLAWLDPLLCKTLLQSIWPYTEVGVAMPVRNYVLWRWPMFKTAIVICLFNYLTSFVAKCRLSNGSNLSCVSWPVRLAYKHLLG